MCHAKADQWWYMGVSDTLYVYNIYDILVQDLCH